MIRLLPLLLLLSGCAFIQHVGQPPLDKCNLPCGLHSYHASDCGDLAKETDRAIDALGTVKGWSRPFVCAKVETYVISIIPAVNGSWNDTYFGEGHVAGLADCLHLSVHVGGGIPLTKSSLAHELAHAVERCADPGGKEHTRWQGVGGVYEALEKFGTAPEAAQ
jgi:hypothetical protein